MLDYRRSRIGFGRNMRQKSITVNGVGTSPWIPMDYKQSPFSLGMSVTVNGPITYTIEHTFDDIYNPAVTPSVFKHPVLQAQAVSENGMYDFPIRAFRLKNTSGVGSTTVTFLQGLR